MNRRAPDADGWVALSDVQWMNIVNHDHAYENMSKDDAVHAAVKAAEAKLKELNCLDKRVQLRDSFAAAALQGFIACHAGDETRTPHADDAAQRAYGYADAMLAERAK